MNIKDKDLLNLISNITGGEKLEKPEILKEEYTDDKDYHRDFALKHIDLADKNADLAKHYKLNADLSKKEDPTRSQMQNELADAHTKLCNLHNSNYLYHANKHNELEPNKEFHI